MTKITEQELVEGCRKGKRSAQYELYNRYCKAMYSTCVRMCGNREDAEDILQSSFADVYHKLDYYRGDATIGAWIKRIVINNCLNHLKKNKIHFSELNETITTPISEENTEPPDFKYKVNQIQEAVKQLPNGYRTVLSLYLFEGFDHIEISKVLNISEQTSKSQYSRARKKLREQLQHLSQNV